MIRLFICAVGLFLLSPLYTNSSAHAAVVINELYPKTEPVTYEWVELYNTGSEAVSLDRWHLDHTAGDVKSFILNAGAVIGPHGFLTFSGSQTAISFSIEGDTVRLFDVNGTLVDSKSYPGILGYNTSMGQSTDGSGTWTLCTTSTYNMPNDCPQPSPTPTPVPTNTPQPKADLPLTGTPTPTSVPTKIPPPIPTPTPTRQTFGSFVLGAKDIPSPTPTPDQTSLTVKMDRILAYQILTIAAAWGIIAVIAYVRRKRGIK